MYLADLLSLSRVVAVIPLFCLSWFGQWRTAFIVLAIAWLTDMLDGKAARRWGSLGVRLYFHLDRFGDGVLQVGVLATLVLTKHPYQRPFAACMLAMSVAILTYVVSSMRRYGSVPTFGRFVYVQVWIWAPVVLYAYLAFGGAGLMLVAGLCLAAGALYRDKVKENFVPRQSIKV